MNFAITLLQPAELQIPELTLPVWFDARWMEGMREYFKFHPHILLCERAGNLAALLPVYEKRVLSHRRAVIPMLNFYQPLCHFDKSENPNRSLLNQLETTQAIAAWLRQYYRKVNLSLHPDNYDVRGFSWEGYKALPRYTMYYDTTTVATLFKDEKNALHRAQRQDYQFQRGFEPQRFTDLLYALYQRKKVDFPVAAPVLSGFLSAMHDSQVIRQYNVLKDGRIVSANIVITDRDRVYTWMRASEEDDLKTGVSVFHSVRLYDELSQEYALIDMCGANSASTARFKTGMGGKLKLFFHVGT
ncbi:MAG: hypothetical protein FJ006_11640 [Chloroflexi bacterium]|nr:hypothetical protein [Chloroflexota bacterium]